MKVLDQVVNSTFETERNTVSGVAFFFLLSNSIQISIKELQSDTRIQFHLLLKMIKFTFHCKDTSCTTNSAINTYFVHFVVQFTMISPEFTDIHPMFG